LLQRFVDALGTGRARREGGAEDGQREQQSPERGW
jgi:hypothetical protein